MPTTHLIDRAVLRIAGPEARDFLQDMLTNDLSGPLPVYAGLLSAQGKTMFDMILHQGGEELLVDVAASHAEALAKRLGMYKLRRAVTIEASDAQVYARWDAFNEGPDGERPADPRLPEMGERWLGFGGHARASLEDYHRHRLALGVPDTAEMTDLLWLETDAAELNGVSFTKGCYVGQENTARMHHRDKLRRRLLPVRGAAELGPIMAGDREAGELRSRHGDLGMAYLRMEHAGGELVQGGVPVAVIWPAWLPRDAG
ncbi:folate-binding protein [Sphingosinicellaceae bacterium]|nr:folate-binding protein [Sphingosinicellaceae bacterium]